MHETVEEAAQRLDIKPDGVKKLCQREQLKAINVSRRWFIPEGEMPRRSNFGPRPAWEKAALDVSHTGAALDVSHTGDALDVGHAREKALEVPGVGPPDLEDPPDLKGLPDLKGS